jgi:hypothetical protein
MCHFQPEPTVINRWLRRIFASVRFTSLKKLFRQQPVKTWPQQVYCID